VQLLIENNPGYFSEYLWSFRPEPKKARYQSLAEVPAVTEESEKMSAELKHKGFRFVGPTTMYALMQATGMVNDHLAGCHKAD
jgi:DNA-3-methyladenine glycosylase I